MLPLPTPSNGYEAINDFCEGITDYKEIKQFYTINIHFLSSSLRGDVN